VGKWDLKDNDDTFVLKEFDIFPPFCSFLASQFTARVGEWDLTDNDEYSVEQEVQSFEEGENSYHGQ
jgi:hypothetical protein